MAVHSNDRMTWNTKLNHIGARARNHPDTVFNNLGHVLTVDLMRKAYQELSGNKAVGVDKVTKAAYGEALDENISNLLRRIRRKQYRPKASRIVEIPKEDGSTRPLAISCFEDKMVEWAVSQVLEQIYEPVFLQSSYGFRPDRSCHDALRALNQHTHSCEDGAVVEIDINKCFNTISSEHLMPILKLKISDTRFLWLIESLLTAPIIEEGQAVPTKKGCSQGSVVSPILCNIFLHYVIDEWFHTVKQTHIRGKAEQVRYSDDSAKRKLQFKPVEVRSWELAMDPGSVDTGKVG